MSSDEMQRTAEGYSPAELAQMAGVKALPIMQALKAAGREATLNQMVTVEDLAAALANVQPEGMQLIGYLTRNRNSVADALAFEPGRDPVYLWRYMHGTQDLEAMERIDTLEVLRVYAATQSTAFANDADGEAFRVAARLGLTLRFDGGVAQSASPGAPCAYEVVSGHDRAAAMRQADNQAAAVVAAGGESHEASMRKVRATTAAPELAELDDGAVETILGAVGITVWGPQAEAVIRAVRIALAESKDPER